jgi:hypothetical protein
MYVAVAYQTRLLVVLFSLVVMFELALAGTGSLPSLVPLVQPYLVSLTLPYPSSSR